MANTTLAAFLAQSRLVLRKSGRVYRYGDSIVYEARWGNDPHLMNVDEQVR
jgi:hypothetical protein